MNAVPRAAVAVALLGTLAGCTVYQAPPSYAYYPMACPAAGGAAVAPPANVPPPPAGMPPSAPPMAAAPPPQSGTNCMAAVPTYPPAAYAYAPYDYGYGYYPYGYGYPAVGLRVGFGGRYHHWR